MILVCTGGRHYRDFEMVDDVLSLFKPDSILVGDASGADLSVREWAKDMKIPLTVFEADWGKHGRAAGPIRNRDMLKTALDCDDSVIVIAFPGGKGTENCIKTAVGLNMIILRVEG